MSFEYALVSPTNEIVRVQRFAHPLENTDVSAHKHKPRWLPVVTVEPTFNALSHVRENERFTVGADQVVRDFPVRAKTPEEIAALRARKKAEIESEFQRRCDAPIVHEAGDDIFEWHADQAAVANISNVVLMIAAGVPVPNPRPWTPKDSLVPVDITHAELIGLGVAIATRKDALFAKKKVKQAELAALNSAVEIADYDATEGW